MRREKTTLREFINKLEEISGNGKNDNIRVITMDYDDDCFDIGWDGIYTVFPQEEVEELNPQNGEKCLLIQMG